MGASAILCRRTCAMRPPAPGNATTAVHGARRAPAGSSHSKEPARIRSAKLLYCLSHPGRCCRLLH
eukprot:4850354-Pyramimonas_sp.AAC.1